MIKNDNKNAKMNYCGGTDCKSAPAGEVNPLLANLEHVLTDFGKQKGTDYQPEDLLRTAQLTDYYPDTENPAAARILSRGILYC